MNQQLSSLTLSLTEQNEFERCEVVIRQGLETFIEVGTALMTIREKRLYRAEFGTFEEYCRERWGMVASRARQLIAASEAVSNIESVTIVTPRTESQARPLTSLEPEVQREAWREVVETHGEAVTAAKVQEVADRWKPVSEQVRQAKEEPMFSPAPEAIIEEARNNRPLVGLFTGQNEWYTPVKYIESARLVMGCIDVDPASNEEAQRAIKAREYYTIETDGLSKEWWGNVWMNPPYSAQEIKQFVEKLRAEVESGRTNQAVVLTNNNTDTSWFHLLAGMSSLICFTRGRINFYRGSEISSPTNGQSFFYIGPNTDAFAKEFSAHGLIMESYDKK